MRTALAVPALFFILVAPSFAANPTDPASLVAAARLPFASHEPLALASAHLSATTLPQYSRLEIAVDLRATFDNPFDPSQVSLLATFAPPSGAPIVVRGFYMIPYTPKTPGTILTGDAPYRQDGPPAWKVRFTPRLPGRYTCTLAATDRTGKRATFGPLSFMVTPSHAHGAVRVARANPRYFEYDDGTLFYPSGADVAWTHEFYNGHPKATYEHYLPELAAAGGNATRIFVCHWSWLEWTPSKLGGDGTMSAYAGCGFYNQRVAAGLDRIFALAEKLGLEVVWCDNTAEELIPGTDRYDNWRWNPYNSRNAGPCASPADFWTSPAARRLYLQRLAYINARWGYSTSFWCWNFWNNCDDVHPAQASWLTDIYASLRRLQTNFPDRPIGTNFGTTGAAFLNHAMDYINGGGGKTFFDRVRTFGDYWRRKPFVIFECAFDAGDPSDFLPSVHRSFWRAAGNGMAGAMCWAWELFEKHGWREFRPVHDFMAPLPLNREPTRTLDAKLTSVRLDGGEKPFVVPVSLHPVHHWGVKDPRDTFHVSPQGCPHEADLYAALYSRAPSRAPWRTTPRFIVDSPAGATLVIEVGEIGAGDQVLSVTVDGARVLRKLLPHGRREINDPAERYARIAIAPGRHEVVVANDGADWVVVASYVFLFQARDPNALPPVHVLGRQGKTFAFAWLENIYADPATRVSGVEPRIVEVAALQLSGLTPGKYRVIWWDTHAGKPLAESSATTADGHLSLYLPSPLATDIAVRLTRD